MPPVSQTPDPTRPAPKWQSSGYPLALALVALLSLVTYLVLQGSISSNADTARLVNVAGRQRMLSQRIALEALLLASDASPGLRQKLLESISQFETAHRALLVGSPALGLPGTPSPAVQALYFSAPLSVNDRVQSFIAHARRLANRPSDQTALVAVRGAALGALLTGLEAVVRQYELEGEARVARLQGYDSLALGVMLLVLILEALLIFRPLERRANTVARTLLGREAQAQALLELSERRTRERDLLEQVQSELARELEPAAACRMVVSAVAETFGYPLVSLYLRRGETMELQHQVGYDRPLERLELNRGVLGRVVQSGKPVLIEDVKRDQDFIAASGKIVSEVCVPLRLDGAVVGAFNLETTGEQRLTGDDLRLMLALAAHVEAALSRSRLYSEARDRENQARALLAISRLAQQGSDPRTVARQVAALVAEPVGVQWIGLTKVEADLAVTETLWRSAASSAEFEAVTQTGLPRGMGTIWRVLERGQVVFADDYSRSPDASKTLLGLGVRAAVWIPIGGPGARMALTAVRFGSADPWSARDRELFEAAARSVSITYERREHLHQLESAAFGDVLTGLGNRRAFETDLESELSAARRHGHAISVMSLDLDGLKTVNDTYGHERGDELLRSFARLLRKRLRTEDKLYRLGGDEYAAILGFANPAGFGAIKKRVAQAVQDLRLEGFIEADVSAGLASFPTESANPDDLLRLSDTRMYEVKLQHRTARAS